jgi:hypothetical protein
VKNVVQRKSSGPLEYLLYPYFEKLKLIIVRLGFVRMVLPPKLYKQWNLQIKDTLASFALCKEVVLFGRRKMY